MKEHKHAEVLRAIADGKEVQCKYKDERDWEDYNEDLHASPLDCTELLEWRVKPEPKPDYCFYAGYNGEYLGSALHDYPNHVNDKYEHKIKITIDGETNEPKSVELVK